MIDLMLLIRKHRVDIILFLIPERIQFPGLGFHQIALSIIRIADQLCLDVFPGLIFYDETVVVVSGICGAQYGMLFYSKALRYVCFFRSCLLPGRSGSVFLIPFFFRIRPDHGHSRVILFPAEEQESADPCQK